VPIELTESRVKPYLASGLVSRLGIRVAKDEQDAPKLASYVLTGKIESPTKKYKYSLRVVYDLADPERNPIGRAAAQSIIDEELARWLASPQSR
jgi:hypothetical protein